ncbi:hypothetical protein ACE1ET_05645 [Saccharicrinis sp. FJH62]|uniref:hypothetical protein n=1 Tax=Saccharicrinis sp. FJH62 TaxID=3344657 RepID=UPI0035D47669
MKGIKYQYLKLTFTILFLPITFFSAFSQINNLTGSDSLLQRAQELLEQRKYERCRDMSLKALDIDPNCGQAYILIAYAYILTADSCFDKNLEKRMVYFLALDKFEKAKEVDTLLTEKVNKLINIYSNYLPDLEECYCFFYEGDTVKIGCWINENTVIRNAH